jgi:hypothetical protein
MCIGSSRPRLRRDRRLRKGMSTNSDQGNSYASIHNPPTYWHYELDHRTEDRLPPRRTLKQLRSQAGIREKPKLEWFSCRHPLEKILSLSNVAQWGYLKQSMRLPGRAGRGKIFRSLPLSRVHHGRSSTRVSNGFSPAPASCAIPTPWRQCHPVCGCVAAIAIRFLRASNC